MGRSEITGPDRTSASFCRPLCALMLVAGILLFVVNPSIAGLSLDHDPVYKCQTYPETQQEALTLAQIRQIPAEDWLGISEGVVNFSFSTQAHWVRVDIANLSDQPSNLVVTAAQPLQDYIDAWLVGDDGQVRESWQTGDRRPAEQRPIQHRAFAFPVAVAPEERVSLYLRLDTHDGLYDAIPLEVASEADFFRKAQRETLWFGFYYGALVILLLYNGVIGLVIPSLNFLLYSVYLGSFLGWNLAFRGFFSEIGLPGGTWWNNGAVAFFSIAIFLSLNAFTLRFLNLRASLPRLRLALLAVSVAMLYPLALTLLGHYARTFAVMIPVALVNLLLILLAATWIAWRGQRSAQIYLLAWGLLILSALAHYAKVYDLLASNWLTENALNIGSLVEMLVLSLALADRFKQLERQRLEGKNRLIKREQELNEELQSRVDEQTAELKAANELLARESITDPMTGLLNRRTFMTTLDSELKRAHRAEQLLCLVLIDLDYFKSINDRFGHPEGDRLLKRFARILQDHWQRSSDSLYRIGGEEFAIIVVDCRPQDIRDQLDTMRPILAGDRALSEVSEDVNLTLSAGIALIPPGADVTANRAYSLADEALYQCKSEGRNTSRFITPLAGPTDDPTGLFQPKSPARDPGLTD